MQLHRGGSGQGSGGGASHSEPIPGAMAARGHDETPTYPLLLLPVLFTPSLCPPEPPLIYSPFPQLNLDPTTEDHVAPPFHNK